MKHKAMRITIFVLVIFGALTTLAGGIGLLTGAIATPTEWLEGSPFIDYTIPGLALAIIVLAATLWMTEFRSQHFPTNHISHA